MGIVSDEETPIRSALLSASFADLILTSGGVSVGDRDLVQEVLAGIGFQTIFWKVAIKPGKPVLFGTLQNQLVVGLPGNPTSSLVVFEVLVRPLLQKMRGNKTLFRPTLFALLQEHLTPTPNRLTFVRGILWQEEGTYKVRLAGKQDSAMLKTLSRANGLILLPSGDTPVKAGSFVESLFYF